MANRLPRIIARRIMLINARKLQRPGRPDLILVAIDDITIRSGAEAHRDVLISEMSHRVKNVLAAVQSIASQTLRQSGSVEGFKAAFNGRLHALASAHDLLVDEGWGVAICASSCGGRWSHIVLLANRSRWPVRSSP